MWGKHFMSGPDPIQIINIDAMDWLNAHAQDGPQYRAVITDPPYGLNYQSNRRPKEEQYERIENDGRPFIWWLWHAYQVTQEGGSLLCFCPWQHSEVWRIAIETAGYEIRSQVIWDRDWHGLGELETQFAPQHDLTWFATKGKGFSFPNGRPPSVIRCRRLAPTDDTSD